MTEPTLADLMKEQNRTQDLISSLIRIVSNQSDLIEELIAKVDEINLPSGEGFEVTYES